MKIIRTPDAPIPAGHYSQAVIHNGLIFVSGQLPIDAKGQEKHTCSIEEQTEQVLKNGLYYTDDLGKMDEDGYIYVVGRTKDIIKAGGFRVSAKEVEEALLGIDEIHETAVIGVNDQLLGEAIKAFVVLRNKDCTTEVAIRTALKNLLPVYKHPKYFAFCDSLPKNESGKIMKHVLKEEYKTDE